MAQKLSQFDKKLPQNLKTKFQELLFCSKNSKNLSFLVKPINQKYTQQNLNSKCWIAMLDKLKPWSVCEKNLDDLGILVDQNN